MKSFIAMLAVGILFLPASVFAFTLDAGDEGVPVQSITIITETSEVPPAELVLIGPLTGDSTPDLTPGGPEEFTIEVNLGGTPSGEFVTLEDPNAEKRAKLEARIEKLEMRFAKLEARIEKLEAKIAKLFDKNAEKFAGKITKLEEKLAKKQVHIEKITNKIVLLQEKLEALGSGFPVAGEAVTALGTLAIQ